MNIKTAAQWGQMLKNVLNKRMPDPKLPALQPKPLVNLGALRPKLTVPGRSLEPAPVAADLSPTPIHPDVMNAENSLRKRFNDAEEQWMQSGDKPKSYQVGLENELADMRRQHQYAALTPREDGGGHEANDAMRAAGQRMMARNGAPPRRNIPPPEPPRPTYPPVGLDDLGETGTGAWTPGRYTQTGQVPRPLSRQVFRYLTAIPGTRQFDQATPAENLLQSVARPIIANPVTRRYGLLRPAVATGLGVGGAAAYEHER